MHPDFQRAELVSSCWTMSPFFRSGSRGTRTHKSLSRPPVFKTGSSSGRITSVQQLRELESNQRPPGSEPGVTTNSDYPTSFVFIDTHTFARFASSCGGRSRTCGPVVQSHVFLPTETTPQSDNQRDGRDSNPRPTAWKAVTLPIELPPHHYVSSVQPLALFSVD